MYQVRATKFSNNNSAVKGDVMDFLEMLTISEREFTTAQRKTAADDGTAMPDGSFPIKNEEDLHNAVQAIGRASNPAAAKKHIKTRAKALGCEGALPDDWKESAERGIFANVEQLDEAAATTYQPSTGNLTITVIKPGVSKNNRYYSPELLKKSVGIFEGAKMFVDHATNKQDAERPEGSVKDWVGTISSVKCESDGTVKATANIHNEAFKTNLSNLKKAGNLSQMGVSIRAFGEAKDGEVSGKRCKIIESLLGCKSVDFVTFAGAGGQVESMSEAADPDDVMLMDVDTLCAKRPDLIKALESKSTVMVENAKRMRTIKKHNGPADNGSADTSAFTENRPHDIFAKGDRMMIEADFKHGKITAEQKRVLLGEEHPDVASLTETQKKEYKFARLIGISEVDSLKLVKIIS
jgi:hypothetical protein